MIDTIFALSSAPGRAGVAVLRLSGPMAGTVLKNITGRDLPAPRMASRRLLKNPADDFIIDDGLVLWFPAPYSYTGEDVAELHVHGSAAVLDMLLAVLAAQPHCRMALPGEFTRRAFDNEKIDLTQAEAVADILAAETSLQLQQAQKQLAGHFGTLVEQWRHQLIRALAHIEAALDFVDDDLPGGLIDAVRPQITQLVTTINHHLNDNHQGERLRDGWRIVIIGAPNAGKSTLLNALARRDVAIVSPTAGTTRDALDVHLNLGGYPVIITDTAGLRATDNIIEQQGIARAHQHAQNADLKIAVFDGTQKPDAETLSLIDNSTIIVINKCDSAALHPDMASRPDALHIAAETGHGLDTLTAHLHKIIAAHYQGGTASTAPTITRAHHRAALQDCVDYLGRALMVDSDAEAELCAEDVRLALRALGRITGRVDVDDILDIIFHDFCIGK